ncbi:MAG: sulfatase-like hydrolase/transferase [Phycisphaerae bacterium]|nr:sulfatase-like hydrolase/transferase [Phycisphaerae bacterium]
MNRTRPLCTFLAAALGLLMPASMIAAPSTQGSAARPNLVLIMTDNQGPWTLGCYGNREIRTPHIDRLAREGMRFTQAFANNAVCSPTRATCLTGLMPCQHGVHKYISQDVMLGPNAYNTLAEFDSLPRILSKSGYVCGLSGKWHLGDNLRPQEGFTFWVTKPGGHTTGFTDQQIIEHGKIRAEPMHQTEYWTRRGVEFIERNKDRPFFLFLAYNGPYGLGQSMFSESRNRHAAFYADKELTCFPQAKPHPWLRNNREMINNPVSMRKYAAEVSGIDDGVGEVMATLAKLGLDDRTLVVFMADQGLAGGHSGFWGMGDHTRPLTAYDGTMRIPLIFRQPGRISPGHKCDLMVANYDLMPTILSHLGLADKMPARPKSPGRDFDAVLKGKPITWDNVVYYEFENVRAVRTEMWKYIERIGGGPNELYGLRADPGERYNLYDAPASLETQKRLQERLHAFFDRYAEPKWDLWHGGDAKGGLLMGKRPYGPRAKDGKPRLK